MSQARRAAPANNDRRRLLLWISLGILGIAIIVSVGLASRVPPTASTAPTAVHLSVGQAAPPFAVSSTGGPVAQPSSDGKPMLLEVFATWCPHCQRETQVLNNVFARYKGRIDVVAVSGSEYAMNTTSENPVPESQADVITFAQQFHVQYPIAFDPNLDVANKYLQGAYPALYLIGPHGKILWYDSGEIPATEIAKEVDGAIHS